MTDEKHFCTYLTDLIEAHNLNCSHFILEITESVLINDFQNTCNILDRLISKGFTIAIDDFGTGYSSLSLLANLPYHYIKVDKSFVKDNPTDAERKVLESIFSVSQSLGKRVILEGVETQAQSDMLHSMGVTLMQGFFYGKPSKPKL